MHESTLAEGRVPTDDIDRTRRGLLAGAIGALAAMAASLAGRVPAAAAADGDNVKIGVNNAGTTMTTITASPGSASAFRGVNSNTVGRGLIGFASGGSGDAVGVWGQSASTSGRAVVGLSTGTALPSTGIGVYGEGRGTVSKGVYGKATSATGATIGVDGSSASTGGTGVRGIATALTGTTRGVEGRSASPNGIAVNGASVATTNGTGVRGIADGVGGTGVAGFAMAATGDGVGVLGGSASPDGVGVLGTAAGEFGISVLGTSLNSTGVMGVASDNGLTIPAKPKTGVYGHADDDATSRGVHGFSELGRGVFGEATGGSGGFFSATTGFALRTSGRLKFEQTSGIATVATGTHLEVVTPGTNVTASTFVLLTPRGNLGGRDLWFTADGAADTFTIHTSTDVAADLAVGWLVIG